MIVISFLFIFGYVVIILSGSKQERTNRIEEYWHSCPLPEVNDHDIVLKGKDIPFPESDLRLILSKHFPYYLNLSEELKEKFEHRVLKFMQKKIFIIKEGEGFREMPVLVSATAIQLSFGLQHYLFDFYKYIRIYPKEYFADDSFKVLAGNVENNVISISWNHFLKGHENLTDGSNLGLHEMSHALYFQKIIIDGEYTPDFYKHYHHLLSECREAYQTELQGKVNLYSEYADTDLQEFWAESVEIFFEKPTELEEKYPSVYQGMKVLLNQDPMDKTCPIIYHNSSLSQRALYFLSGKSMP